MGLCYREDKWILDSMSIWHSKCVWDTIWLQNTIRFSDTYRKQDGKWLLHDTGIPESKCI